MNKRIFATGLVLVVIGSFLAVAFWPIFGASPSQLSEDRVDLSYESYDVGDEVLVYGTITFIGRPPQRLEGLGTYVEIDEEIGFILDSDDALDFEEGDHVYGRVTLNRFTMVEYWELDGSLRSKRLIDYTFFGVIGVGIATVVVGLIKI